jgi:CheY-like chemotaxis protein
MSPAVLERAGDPLFTTKEHGMGLGLFSVRAFARQFGGFVTIRTEVNEGTRVSVYLPRAEVSQTATRSDKLCVAGNGQRVLVVEDRQELLTLTMERVKALGYRVIGASDGAQAWSILQADHDIDIVLSDIVMPSDINGYQLAARISREMPSLPVLLVTGHAEERLRETGIDGTCTAEVMTKPYTQAALAQVLQRTLRATSSASAS